MTGDNRTRGLAYQLRKIKKFNDVKRMCSPN